MSIEGLHFDKADERGRDEIIKDEKFISTWEIYTKGTNPLLNTCIYMLVSNMHVRNNRSVVEVPLSNEVQWDGQKGDKINNKDKSSFQLWGNLHQWNSLLKHFLYFNVGFKYVDPMLIARTTSMVNMFFQCCKMRDLHYKSSILGCKHSNSLETSRSLLFVIPYSRFEALMPSIHHVPNFSVHAHK